MVLLQLTLARVYAMVLTHADLSMISAVDQMSIFKGRIFLYQPPQPGFVLV